MTRTLVLKTERKDCPECGCSCGWHDSSCPECGYKGKVDWSQVLWLVFIVLLPTIGLIKALLSDTPIKGGDLGGFLCVGIIALIGWVVIASRIHRRGKW